MFLQTLFHFLSMKPLTLSVHFVHLSQREQEIREAIPRDDRERKKEMLSSLRDWKRGWSEHFFQINIIVTTFNKMSVLLTSFLSSIIMSPATLGPLFNQGSSIEHHIEHSFQNFMIKFQKFYDPGSPEYSHRLQIFHVSNLQVSSDVTGFMCQSIFIPSMTRNTFISWAIYFTCSCLSLLVRVYCSVKLVGSIHPLIKVREKIVEWV